MRAGTLSILAIFLCVAAAAQEKPHAFRGATIIPIEGAEIQNGVLLVQYGKILEVGTAEDVDIPSDAVVQDVTGKVILPGLVDTHSHLGDGSGGDRSAAIQPEVRILDAIDVRSNDFKKALAGGITTLNVMPGSGHLMSGQTAYLKIRPANTINDMLFCKDPLNDICGGMKMANGTNSIRSKPFPGTRAKSAAMVRQQFIKAQEYKAKIEAADGDESKMPKRDLEMEALVQVLDGKRVVHHHTHRHDDVLTVLRLAKEFGFRVVLQHVSEAWKVAKEIAESGAPCSIILLDSPGGKLEAVDIRWESGGVLEKAGVLTGFHTDDGITDSRLFLRSAAFAVRAGMSRQKALEGLTIAGAKMLDLQERVGSLKPGKDADFVILSGDPLSVYTHIEQSWVEGIKMFDRANPDDHKIATGGYNVFRTSVFLDECEGGAQ
ncbi:MAG: amidohydrolase family protein [Ignavibacteriae bacterium]|nr:amidohydrolase family protein [Ignavibacteriota bacterium]